MSTDIEIASRAELKPIGEIAASIGLSYEDIVPHGHHAAKLPLSVLATGAEAVAAPGRLVLVTAMSPTPAGEGKTTTSIGLADAFGHLAREENWPAVEGKAPAVLALREPSLGPVFGMKGGAAGGGWAQVLPMEDINLHFTGDFAAIALANNLACTMLDNHMHFGNELDIDPRRITIRRVVDLNDRALRQIAIGLGGYNGGIPREDAFDIVVASEVMAIFCLATSLEDLKERLGRIVVARTRSKKAVTVDDLGAAGAMTALLRNALRPNLVQTIEHTPAFIHGGPFANIAHGCNSVLATAAARRFGQWAVTEAGFGADLGAEKFLDITMRAMDSWPDAAVVVATVRALKYHGGVPRADLELENLEALEAGLPNLRRHLSNLSEVFGVATVVSINRFPSDTDAEVDRLVELLAAEGIAAVPATHWADGGAGAVDLARAVVGAVEGGAAAGGAAAGASTGASAGAAGATESESNAPTSIAPAPNAPTPQYCYDLDESLEDKIEAIAVRTYGALGIEILAAVRKKLDMFTEEGFGGLPVCIAKTQYSFSTDAAQLGAPTGHTLTVRDVRLSAGAGFVVVICGEIMTMPGLPRNPAALKIDVDGDGRITGLF
ncbi:formate--tetrahydrofolate ligase [Brevibacterium sp. R8603A2]|uniref:formate--tetrahydrofolate ligase n=1 Tax=Brevibacterium sp. R8603A2 TaxID=2929779 RepID=UPI001FFBEB07|nr:formate--tetrahydrofolate ligase [Brevibacterium sp. R8603A2]MCK1801621.1 formate--tetrahydrofolate ligase [Brevibacterium sp. R8603A2]